MAPERSKVIGEPPSNEGAVAASPAAEEIRSQIEHTRGGVSQPIDTIGPHPGPSHVVTPATEAAKDATAGRKGLAARINDALKGVSGGALDTGRAMSAVTKNPVPAVALGVAATAIVARTLSRSRSGSAAFRADRYRHSIGRQLLIGTCAGIACWGVWQAGKRKKDSETS